MVNLLCCAVEQVLPGGVSFSLLPRLEEVLVGNSGLGAVSLVPLRISDLNRVLVDVSVRVMGGGCSLPVQSFADENERLRAR